VRKLGAEINNQGLAEARFENAAPNCAEARPRRARANHGLRIAVLSSGIALGLAFFLALMPTSARVVWEEFARIIELKNGLKIGSAGESRANISSHLNERLALMGPQQQAELLVEALANDYDGSIAQLSAAQLSARMEGWRGHLMMSPRLSAELDAALNSNDLRVRAAAIEMELVAYDLPKTRESADRLIDRASNDPAGRAWALWMLGAIGNRGVEPERALHTLTDYSRDSDEKTRFWAVEGLSLLGTDATIQPLLQVFRNDPSLQIRQRAGFSLSQAGMLTKEQRLTAVPALMALGEDSSIDSNTRNWVYEALRGITGARYGTNPADWREWWARERSQDGPR
jgi:HEAT repeat protein